MGRVSFKYDESSSSAVVGHVTVQATFYNPSDYLEYTQKQRRLEEVRQKTLPTLVDTGATFPALPRDVVDELGLVQVTEREGEVHTGTETIALTLAVSEVDGRDAVSYVIIRPARTTPLLGVVALEQMGYRVDPVAGKLVRGQIYML